MTEREKSDACRPATERSTKVRHSWGVMAAVLPCQIIGAMETLYTAESCTGTYFFLADLLKLRAQACGFRTRGSGKASRLAFLNQHSPLVWYDCACTLYRFMRSPKRRARTSMAKALSQLSLSIDKFHFRKGHAGCKPGGSRELPAVWP